MELGETLALLDICKQIPNLEIFPSVSKLDPVTIETASVEEM
jgi:hypothetical protein